MVLAEFILPQGRCVARTRSSAFAELLEWFTTHWSCSSGALRLRSSTGKLGNDLLRMAGAGEAAEAVELQRRHLHWLMGAAAFLHCLLRSPLCHPLGCRFRRSLQRPQQCPRQCPLQLFLRQPSQCLLRRLLRRLLQRLLRRRPLHCLIQRHFRCPIWMLVLKNACMRFLLQCIRQLRHFPSIAICHAMFGQSWTKSLGGQGGSGHAN